MRLLFLPKTAADLRAPPSGDGGSPGPSFCTPAALRTESTQERRHRRHRPASAIGPAFVFFFKHVAERAARVSVEDPFKTKRVFRVAKIKWPAL